MARYIDADELKKSFDSQSRRIQERLTSDTVKLTCAILSCGILMDIQNAPTADVVEVVRCKDCKYYTFWKRKGIRICERWTWDPHEAATPGIEDFCSFAERRDREITGKAGEKEKTEYEE